MKKRQGQSLDYEHIFSENKVSKSKAFRTLVLLYQGQYRNLTMSLIFYLIKQSPVWIISIITANMINIANKPADHSLRELWIDLVILAVVIIQNIPTTILHTGFTSRASRQVEAGLRSTLIRKLQHLSISYHSELRSGKLQSKVLRDVEAIEFLSKQVMFALLPAFLNVFVVIAITVSKSLLIASFFIVIAPVAVSLVFMFRRSIQSKNRDFRNQIEHMSGQVAETVEMIPVTRAHGLEDMEIEKVDLTLRSLKGKGFQLDIAEAFFNSSGWVIFQLFQVSCLAFTSLLAYKGQIPIGDIVMYQSLFTSIMMSVNQLINVFPNMAKGYESIYSVSEILLSKELEEYQGTVELDSLKGSYQFEHVHFHYRDTDKHVLQDFNLHVRRGECIAFVGESGAGKSTVLNMVVGFYRPTHGRILLDGVPMDDLDMKSYRQKLAVVPQSTILFSGTIRSNITYGLTDVSEEHLLRVIKMANLQDVIAEMPDGLETSIGEHGNKLSGGQRQRIAIARALIRNPQIIILDEATSALDNISEYQVQKAMRALIQGRTTFIVAHRLSTIRDANRIVVMKHGKCVEVGTYEELMGQQGEFYQLKQMQS